MTTKISVNFHICISVRLKEADLNEKRNYIPPNRINFFIVYELGTWSRDLNSDFTLKDCLFRVVKLAKNTDQNKYIFTGYGIGFDSRSVFSLSDGSIGNICHYFWS